VIKNKGNHKTLAKRIISEVDVALLIRHADNSKQARKGGQSQRSRVMLMTAYAGALRISELIALLWADVIAREDGKMQLTVLGKGQKRREVLLPAAVGKELLALRGEAADDEPVFQSRQATAARTTKHPKAMSESSVTSVVKRAAKRAGINPKLSMHWLRHAHASHAIDRGATLPVVQSTLGHSSVVVTSVYLHARRARRAHSIWMREFWEKLAMDAIEGGKKTIFSKQEADQIYGQLERIEQRFTQLITAARSRRTQTHGTATGRKPL
jgi:integrase/recombinase XerD